MDKTIFLCVTTVLLLWVSGEANGLKCYVCSDSANCEDPFAGKEAMESGDNCEFCVKTKSEPLHDPNAKVVERKCLPLGSTYEVPKMECEMTPSISCYCNSDLCNGAATGVISMVTIVTSLLTLLMAKLVQI